MIELLFIIFRLPRIMSQLARERNRSAIGWSLAAILAWIGTEVLIVLGYFVVYEIGKAQWGWSEREPRGLLLLIYIIALIAALVSADIVRRILRSMPPLETPPPPPPQF